MNEPERPISTFHAFCSLVLPGLGQLLQKRFGAALGFFVLFLLSGFLPAIIVCLLFMDRFSYQPLRVHILHILTFGGLYFLFLLAIFWSVLDAARNPKEKPSPLFTFARLLGVIAVLGVLIALLLPAIPSAREPARRMQCSNHLKRIMNAFYDYREEHGHFPPAYTVDENGKPLHGWRVLILPYIEIETNGLYEKIRQDEPWDSEHNRQFHSEAPSIFRCPSNPREARDFRCPTCHQEHISLLSGSFYSVIVGEEAAFFGSETKSSTEEERKDAIFLAERRIPVNWMDPSREMTFETACKGVNVDAMGISSYHPEIAHVGLGDGSVGQLPNSIDGKILRKMLTLPKNPGK